MAQPYFGRKKAFLRGKTRKDFQTAAVNKVSLR